MKSDGYDTLVNWEQVHDLVGDPSNQSEHGMLRAMWSDMRADMVTEWKRLEHEGDEAKLKQALHRLRGVVSMWGLDALAASMQSIEKGPQPLAEWRHGFVHLTAMRDRSFGVITNRFPWLGVEST